MLQLKSQLTCSYCSKIFKYPILLPCDHSICLEHLTEKEVVKVNRIKCKKCNEEFGVKKNDFKSNEDLNKLIESQSYLNVEERSLKKELEVSIQKFFEFYDEFVQTSNKLDLDVFNHFQEMRFQIDEHREELKKKIDDIALDMIDEIKKNEEIYLKNLKESFSSFDDCKSLDTQYNEIEDTFRNPNLLIETIKEMQQKQKESLNEIQLKLNEMNQVKVHLKVTNHFKPNPFLLNQNEMSIFGSIKLNVYSKINSFDSEILKGDREYLELINLCEFSPNDKWSLLYRGTRDGFGSDVFHSKCDGHSNTLTVLKAKQSSYIFGGFTAVSWDGSSGYNPDPNAFLFSLTNKDNEPLKMKVYPNKHECAIYCHSEYGPSFGGGHDISIANNANTTIDSVSYLGYSYKHPQYDEGTNEAKSFLAGSYKFQLDEIEVYKKE
jgi:hypothetical protein